MSSGVTLARWARGVAPSALQRMLEAAAAPDVLSLSLGLPAAELFPCDALADAARAVLAAPRTLQYGMPSAALKRHVVRLMRDRGVACDEDEIFLTSGAQQGIQLLARLLLEPGGRIVTDSLTYTGFLQAVQPMTPSIAAVPIDAERGPDLARLADVLASDERPAFIYAMADGHNPLGESLSAAQRQRLVDLARAHGVPVVEDGAYAFLQYEDAAPPPLRALDREWVLHVGSFSKILGPTCRVGWIVAPPALMGPLSILKESMDINTATLSQHTVCRLLETMSFDEHVARLREAYRTRRNAMRAALASELPAGARWRTPACGFFFWIDVPGLDASVLLEHALAVERTAFVPGEAFSADGVRRAVSCLRLSFSNAPIDRMADGVARLARAMRRAPVEDHRAHDHLQPS